MNSKNPSVRGWITTGLLLLVVHVTAWGQVQFRQPPPGSYYKEYGRVQTGNDLLVTDPNATATGAQEYLPNPVLYFNIDDLQDAKETVDVLIEMWGGHEATTGKAVRFNGNAWIPVPELNSSVNGLESGHSGQCYFHQVNSVISVPKSHLVQGSNSIQGTNTGQHGCIDRWGNNLGWGWGLWGMNAFIVRVYYNSPKSALTGAITSVSSGGILTETLQSKVLIAANASAAAGVERVDFLVYHDGYDTDGDGVFLEYHHQYPELPPSSFDISDHAGTDYSNPYSVEWDTRWVPDQASGSMKVLARIKDNNGYWYVTPEITGLSLQRNGRWVALYKPYNVPEQFNLDHGQTKHSNFYVPPAHNLGAVTGARMFIRSWNGTDNDGTGTRWTKVNSTEIGHPYGYGYEYRCDLVEIPTNCLIAGENKVEFYGESVHHGIDIMWPGPAIVVEYSAPLPIQLASFKAIILSQDAVRLQWTTLSETNNYGFEVQKSIGDATHYASLPGSFIPGHGTTTVLHQYEYTDRTLGAPVAYYRLRQIDLDSTIHYTEGIRVQNQTTGVNTDAVPSGIELIQNYPNPFNPQTTIRFAIPASGHVSLKVFDVLGNEVRVLVDEYRPAGYYDVLLEAGDLPSGLYLYRLQSAGNTVTRKLTVLK
jgi:hypothetical protein